jgi:hypothetical protein
VIFKNCQSTDKKDNYCENNCIRPKGIVEQSINDVIIKVSKNDREFYPPSEGSLEIINNILFFRKKRYIRERDVIASCHCPSAVVVYIPKRKKGWQCLLVKKEEIQSITHSLFESILGLYVLRIKDNKDIYLIKIGKGGKNYLSKKLDIFMKSLEKTIG